MKTAKKKRPIGTLFSNIIVLTRDDIIFSVYYMKLVYKELPSGEYTLFELRLFCYLALLKHCAEAIQLSEELSKVLGICLEHFLPIEHDRVCAGSGQSQGCYLDHFVIGGPRH